MNDRREAIWQAAFAHKDEPMGMISMVDMIADAVETGLTWAPPFRCPRKQPRFGKVCRMNENHKGTHRSADGEEW